MFPKKVSHMSPYLNKQNNPNSSRFISSYFPLVTITSAMSPCPYNFRGFMAPVFTPFNNDQEKSLNLSVIPEYAKYLVGKGIKGVLVNGTTGEGTSQTVRERELVAEAWIESGRDTGLTVMVQVGGTNLKDVQRLASHAESCSASAILCLADLFHRPQTPQHLVHYLKLVSGYAPNTPLLYYHLPGFTGIDVDMKEFLRQSHQIPTFAGIKFTSTDLETGTECLSIDSGKNVLFLGSDVMLFPAFLLGFHSAICTTLNIMPEDNFAVCDAVTSGRIALAAERQKKLTSCVKKITKYGNWVESMKGAMNVLTPVQVGPVREPLIQLSQQQLLSLCNDLVTDDKSK